MDRLVFLSCAEGPLKNITLIMQFVPRQTCPWAAKLSCPVLPSASAHSSRMLQCWGRNERRMSPFLKYIEQACAPSGSTRIQVPSHRVRAKPCCGSPSPLLPPGGPALATWFPTPPFAEYPFRSRARPMPKGRAWCGSCKASGPPAVLPSPHRPNGHWIA